MSVWGYQRCIKCAVKNIRSFHTHSRHFTKQNISIARLTDATKQLTEALDICNEGAIFAGTGQYIFKNNRGEDRMTVLNFGENFLKDAHGVSRFDTKALIDGCVDSGDMDSLMDTIKQHSRVPVYTGELDFITTSPWQYGFTLKPFSIFTADERLCVVVDDLVHISVAGSVRAINVADIAFVGLGVSDEPYNEQRLFFRLVDKTTVTLIEVERNHTACDLAKLTVDT